MANFHFLNNASYSLAAHLFTSLNNHLGVQAILSQQMPGKIYVDYPASPHSALLQHGQRFYLAGQADNQTFNRAVRSYFENIVIPETREIGAEGFILYFTPDDWQPKLELIMEAQRLIPVRHYYYQREVAPQDWQTRVPAGFSLRWIERTVLEESSLQNLDDLKDELLSEAPSVDFFLAQRFGVCGVLNDSIAGFCTSENDLGERCELGINILEPYQRRGLATALVLCMIDRAHQRGIRQIGWHCHTGNQPSIATAKKSGFQQIAEYPSLFIHANLIRSTHQ
ncbi:MAG: GNAT family N-acetyltransferase [Anaerolineales bacterium]|nr:GNAT family N-acetyltransferase [Anaerolineales bacterium]